MFTPVGDRDQLPSAHSSRPTSAQHDIFQTHSSNGSIPFIYFDGKYLISGATYDVGVLQGKSWDQIATAMSDKSSADRQGRHRRGQLDDGDDLHPHQRPAGQDVQAAGHPEPRDPDQGAEVDHDDHQPQLELNP